MARRLRHRRTVFSLPINGQVPCPNFINSKYSLMILRLVLVTDITRGCCIKHHMDTFDCALCHQPVNLTTDLACDETGKAVHEQCYVDRITGNKDTAIPFPRLNHTWQWRLKRHANEKGPIGISPPGHFLPYHHQTRPRDLIFLCTLWP